jgi:Uma2 family endonuclease
MNVELRRSLTVADYLAWAITQTEQPRTELINGQIVFMAAERIDHNRIKLNVAVAFKQALNAASIVGEVFTDGLTVPIDQFTAYEPDASVRFGSPLPPRGMTVTDPVVVVEVISPSSAHTDTSAKLIGYFKLASVRHYLVIDPEVRKVTHHRRGDDGAVTAQTLTEGTLRLDPPGLAVEIADLMG